MNGDVIRACSLRFVGLGAGTVCDTYVNSTFLSMYPSYYIPYVMLFQATTLIIITQVLQGILTRNLRRFSLVAQYSIIILMLPFLYLMASPSKMTVLVAIIVLPPCLAIVSTNVMLINNVVFSFREYKRVSTLLAAASSIGTFCAGMVIGGLSKFTNFNPVIAMYLLVACMVATLIMIHHSHWQEPPVTIARRLEPESASKNHLFRALFFMFIVILLMGGFIDFSVKSELAKGHSQADVSAILGPFYAFTSVAILVGQLFLAQPFLHKYGVVASIFIYPISVIGFVLGLCLWPTLVMAMILSSVSAVIRYSLFQQGFQIAMNVLPDSMRQAARLQLNSVARNVGLAVSAVMLIIMTTASGGVRMAAILTLLCCILLYYYSLRIQKAYKPNLKSAINLHRFSADYVIGQKEERYMIETMARQAIQEKEQDVQLFGLSLLQTQSLVPPPEVTEQVLASPHVVVRTETIKLLKASNDPNYVSLLLHQFTREQDPAVLWQLVLAIVPFQAECLISAAERYRHSQDPSLLASAIVIYAAAGNLEQQAYALEELLCMVEHVNPAHRLWACRILAVLSQGNLTSYVKLLIADPDSEVVNEAIKLARVHYNTDIIELILDKVSDQAFNFRSTHTLLCIGEACIPSLVARIKRYKNVRATRAGIILLSKIPGERAEVELLGLIDIVDYPIRDISIMALASRAMLFPLSPSTRKVLSALSQTLFRYIQNLLGDITRSTDNEVKTEIEIRIKYLQKSFIYLLAAYCKSLTILRLAPSLLSLPVTSSGYQKSLELLDVSIRDRKLAILIPGALESKIMQRVKAENTEVLQDKWIQTVADYKQGLIKGVAMDLIQKVLVLRKVALFSSLAPEILQSIAESIEAVDMASQQTVFHQGDIGDGLYIVAKGKIAVKRGDVALKQYGPGDFFGELSLLDDEPRAATALAEEDSLLYFLDKNIFDRLTDDVPEILKVLIRTVLGYLRDRPGIIPAEPA
jgi:hypothetical protein